MNHDISTEDMQAFIKSSNAHISKLGLVAGALKNKRIELVREFFAPYLTGRDVLLDNKVDFYNKCGRVINLRNLQELKALLDNHLDAKATIQTALKCFELDSFHESQQIKRERYDRHGNGSFLFSLLWLLCQQLDSPLSCAAMTQQIIDLQDGSSTDYPDIGVRVAVNWGGDIILYLRPSTMQQLNQQI